MRNVSVGASKNYDVWVGDGLLSEVGERISAACGGTAALVVTDDAVNALYGDAVLRSLQAAGYSTARFIFPHGERSKNMETYVSILHALGEANLSRSDVLVALGGGVAGDMAGFAAATYLRGIHFAQIPTTLLAMVDSSVGGKTAIDLPTGKNQAGAFYQPDIVLCDIGTLRTLSDECFSDGCAEVVKHGVILSSGLFELLKQPIWPQLEDIVARNVEIKRAVVVVDEHETGIRRILNFGHTIGHGVEVCSRYSVSHGRAVAIGMAATARAAFRMGVCDGFCCSEIIDMLVRFGLPFETDIPVDMLVNAAFYDKKRSGGVIALVLPEKIGKCIIMDYKMEDLAEFIRLGLAPL